MTGAVLQHLDPDDEGDALVRHGREDRRTGGKHLTVEVVEDGLLRLFPDARHDGPARHLGVPGPGDPYVDGHGSHMARNRDRLRLPAPATE
ncbi:hypothetical protein ACFWAO_04545 [Streptomyces sp. NPDC059981]|uniref:hypothetical protein n=1 Tax=Streptomyces sp. NPDC059981 TaxID=3347023 RepID=UPI0036973EEF